MMLEKTRPENVSHGRGAHRQAGVAGIGFLNCIHGQAADGIDAKLVELSLVKKCLLRICDAISGQGIGPPSQWVATGRRGDF